MMLFYENYFFTNFGSENQKKKIIVKHDNFLPENFSQSALRVLFLPALKFTIFICFTTCHALHTAIFKLK